MNSGEQVKGSEGVQVSDFHTLPTDMNYGHMLTSYWSFVDKLLVICYGHMMTKIKRLQKNLKFICNSHLKQSVTNYGMFVSVAEMDKSVLMTQNCPL